MVASITRQATLSPAIYPITRLANAIGNPLSYFPLFFWVLFALAAVWGVLRRQPSAFFLLVWWGGNLLAANPQWLGLPGAGTITSFTVMIALYIPSSMLIAWTVDDLSNTAVFRTNGKPKKISAILVSLLLVTTILGSALWGTLSRIREIQPSKYSLFTRPDLRAMQWIKNNIPDGAYFLVNAFTSFGGSTVVGSDGGWWLPYFTQRGSTLPPQNYPFDKGPRPDYRTWVNDLTNQITTLGIAHPGVIAELTQRKITHVYVGQLQGMMNSPGALLSLEQMQSSPHFIPVYHQDRVWVFEFKP